VKPIRGERLRIFLTAEQERTLFELRTATTVSQRVKDRAALLRLNAQGWYVEKIATHMNWNVDTVRETIHRWNLKGLGGWWDAPHVGGKRRWQEVDMEHLEQVLRDESGFSWWSPVSYSYLVYVVDIVDDLNPKFGQKRQEKAIA
jgi:hypothetical protein